MNDVNNILKDIETWKQGNMDVSELRKLMVRVNDCYEKVTDLSNLLDDCRFMDVDIEGLHRARNQLVIIRDAVEEMGDINRDDVFGQGIDVDSLDEHISNLDGVIAGFSELDLQYGLCVENDIWEILNWDGVLANIVYSVELGKIMFPGVMDSVVEDLCVQCGGLGNIKL